VAEARRNQIKNRDRAGPNHRRTQGHASMVWCMRYTGAADTMIIAIHRI
jgi:hypothetical protein